MGIYDDFDERMAETKPVDDRDPFIRPGDHELLVASLTSYKDKKWGLSVRATFVVLDSQVHKPGSQCIKIWNLKRPAEFETQTNDGDEFVNFVAKLQGSDLIAARKSCKLLALPKEHGGREEDQLARGVRITATGRTPKAGKTYVSVAWANVEQTGEQIKSNREELDTKRPLRKAAAPKAATPAW